ncbi:MAG: TetR/AcrR family transcriptional regulator [Candidatus Marinimicrobia bacterium]|nr:TetR/AcrR family transcriptional regulator [Candidatus Neomarinimicrobiota bacterium]MCF7850603.1 TetR/AcrR family transcriptional regulator [Candidatus Neomarinimicrobiota bacterium]MCF7903663.1 TetR/AcrR family transcriptional regulator [Candidatus Neomarinimicrobiota bacterium]
MKNEKKSYHHKNLRPVLMDEAAKMIAEGGAASVTMRELGKRVGVSRGAAYRHFSDKDALLMSVSASGFEKLSSEVQSVIQNGEMSFESRLLALGKVYLQFAIENPAHYRLMYGKEALSRWNQPVLKESADGLFDHLYEVIKGFQGECDISEKDTRTLVYVAWSSVHGLASILIEKHIMAEVEIEPIINEAMQTIINGFKAAS